MCPVRSFECVPPNPGSPPPKHSPAIHLQSAFATPEDQRECDERRSNESLLSFANWLVKSAGHEDMHQNRMVYTTRHESNQVRRVVGHSAGCPVDLLVVSVSGGTNYRRLSEPGESI